MQAAELATEAAERESADRSEEPPRKDVVRALPERAEYRAADNGDGPTLTGHFAVFDEWSEIHGERSGPFLERIAPGAFKKTFDENAKAIKVTFQHGHDPSLGDQTLGKIVDLAEDERGAAYEVSLFDGIPPLLMSGLREGDYGASFRFQVIRDDFNHDPERSDYNPEALPERTITEAKVFEFGPVTYPAYEGATAGVRSLTARYAELEGYPHREATEDVHEATEDAPAEQSAEETHPEPARRDDQPVTGPKTTPVLYGQEKEHQSWRL